MGVARLRISELIRLLDGRGLETEFQRILIY
jgi:hypothetical protein